MAEHGIWMPLYWGDYFGKTTALSCLEHGAYLLLIGAYWQRGRALPDDDKFLAQAARLSRKVWLTVRPAVEHYFSLKDGVWYHDRVEKELLSSCKRISSAQAKAHARWHPQDMLITTTITKERKTRARAQPNGNGVDAHALSPREVDELKDRTDRIMKRGKYAEKFS